jgi:catechol 2,3-dioxygenase
MAPPQPNQPNKEATYVADPGTRVGHVHLKAADLERSIRFYSGVLGLQIMQRLGDSPAFLSAGGYHLHVALSTWESLGGPPPPPGAIGLYHSAIPHVRRRPRCVLAARILLKAQPITA